MLKIICCLSPFQACVFVGVGFAIGCGGGGTKGPVVQTAPVSGNVQLGGQPLSDAAVVFTPVQGTRGIGGFGVTDAAGKFSAGIDPTKPGVAPGTYAVTVTKWAQKDGSPIPAGKTAADVEAVQVIPEAYSNPSVGNPKTVVTVPKEGTQVNLQIPAVK